MPFGLKDQRKGKIVAETKKPAFKKSWQIINLCIIIMSTWFLRQI